MQIITGFLSLSFFLYIIALSALEQPLPTVHGAHATVNDDDDDKIKL